MPDLVGLVPTPLKSKVLHIFPCAGEIRTIFDILDVSLRANTKFVRRTKSRKTKMKNRKEEEQKERNCCQSFSRFYGRAPIFSSYRPLRFPVFPFPVFFPLHFTRPIWKCGTHVSTFYFTWRMHNECNMPGQTCI